MSDEPKQRRWWSRAWIWWALIVFLVYPLSAGPAYRWAYWAPDRPERRDTLRVIYKPLTWAMRVPAIGNAMHQYINRWENWGEPDEQEDSEEPSP
jgi:hypothetical protein